MCAKAAKRKKSKRTDQVASVTAPEKIPVFIWGKRYLVPEGVTILSAMEEAGFQLVRGVGCRGGVCGACATVYRKDGQCKIETGLACQTVVEPNMYLAQIPFFPAHREPYDIEAMKDDCFDYITRLYPEVLKCLGCNTCTKSCPMEVNVMKFVSSVLKGDVEQAAKLSFDCVQCGICAARCPAELSQYHVAQLIRRVYGKHYVPRAQHLARRVGQVREGRYDGMLDELKGLPGDELKNRYVNREAEPQMSKPGWMPKERKYL